MDSFYWAVLFFKSGGEFAALLFSLLVFCIFTLFILFSQFCKREFNIVKEILEFSNTKSIYDRDFGWDLGTKKFAYSKTRLKQEKSPLMATMFFSDWKKNWKCKYVALIFFDQLTLSKIIFVL